MLHHYELYGLSVTSELGIPVPECAAGAAQDSAAARMAVEVRRVERPAVSHRWDDGTAAYASGARNRAGEPSFTVVPLDGCDVVRLSGEADFFLFDDRVECHLHRPEHEGTIGLFLLGPVLSLWLERRGILMLHASAVVVDGVAVAFLASNRGGKSSLAATMLQAGYSLLSDDLVPIELHDGRVLARPGYARMRMWPEAASHFLASSAGLETVHPDLSKVWVPVGRDGVGSFHAAPATLARIYLPERRLCGDPDETVELQAPGGATSLVALVSNSFSARIVAALGFQAQRLPSLATVVESVPIKRLKYPSGFDRLGSVRGAILDDLRRS